MTDAEKVTKILTDQMAKCTHCGDYHQWIKWSVGGHTVGKFLLCPTQWENIQKDAWSPLSLRDTSNE